MFVGIFQIGAVDGQSGLAVITGHCNRLTVVGAQRKQRNILEQNNVIVVDACTRADGGKISVDVVITH